MDTLLPDSPWCRTLPAGALDIVGDVHGEWQALQQLLHHLGYDESARHPQGRKLVFVGDLCDRGPDSPAVLDWVLDAAAAERAWPLLGNHEINLLMDDPKDGSGWYFSNRPQDEQRYAPWRHWPAGGREMLCQRLQQWPLAWQRADLRIVHAAWLPESLLQLAGVGTLSLTEQYRHWEAEFRHAFDASRWAEDYAREQAQFAALLEDEHASIPFLPATAQYDLWRSRANPVRSLTCGTEVLARQPFYANGRWRFTARSPWWQDYAGRVPVVMGHYWRSWQAQPAPPGRLPLFGGHPQAWLGTAGKVFCIDYSVGARWRERQAGITAAASDYHLVALRWPEHILVRDDGLQTAAIRTGQHAS